MSVFIHLLLRERGGGPAARGEKQEEDGDENKHLSPLLFLALRISDGCNSMHSIELSLVFLREEKRGKRRMVRSHREGDRMCGDRRLIRKMCKEMLL